MPTDNPFASPASTDLSSGLAPDGEAWSDGDTLFTAREATLPLICAKCGTEQDVTYVPLKVQWTPIWARLTILLSPLIFLIVFFIVRKKCHVQVGLCGSHRSQRMIGQVGGIGLILGGVALMLGGIVLDAEAFILPGLIVGLVALVVGLILAVVMAMPLRVVRVTDAFAEFKGAHAELLRAVERG